VTPAQYALGLLLLVAAVTLSTAAFAALASLFWFGYEIRAYLSECVFGSTEACRLYTETFNPFD